MPKYIFIKEDEDICVVDTDLVPKIVQGACVMFGGKYRFVGYVDGDEVLLVHSKEPPIIAHPTQCVIAPGFWTHVE